ncbi:NAD(P)-dependent dehydrogenase (short-subunit alcohol dehydrogenase family) [Kibdelosporangium banguiense]|uniref:NAD(P)-dependent dehydrogenase (Short-subunit alcohol dehydrogenase family) n=1 Tax=Kibdelosporangium banguiense TaxID=1365924 RepID=A0ABS4U2Z5_9PSEU|nr:SDR family oxidoreductase [Kibdelosporangium banguiense]MBP2330991.1 NAD(P)-dependent dehydrogenase (short-subunit alcohol dehydrogenase family) [Kibdelosporangium banguiense]
MGTLDGKAVVITGAGRGLGRAYAVHAADAGASVLVNDVDGELADEVAAGIRAAGGRAVANGDSVAELGRAAKLMEQCVAEFGKLDGLVNNAGLRYDAMPWEDDPEQIRALIEVNVLGALYCGTAAAAVMREQGGGVIVNAASFSFLGQSGAGTYAASKGAVVSMSISWAVDLAKFGIRVNAVCPLAWTRMSEADYRTRSKPEDTPDRVAPLITYLLGDRSSAVTGQVIRFTGDILHVVRQPARKEPVFTGEPWDDDDFEKAFGEFDLEIFPAERWKL